MESEAPVVGNADISGGGGVVIAPPDEQQYVLFQRPGEPVDAVVDTGAATARGVVEALGAVREQLRVLRERRTAVNRAIKRLVTQETHLERMARIANELLKGGEEGEDEGPGGTGVVDA